MKKHNNTHRFGSKHLVSLAGLTATGGSLFTAGSHVQAQTIISDTFTSGSQYAPGTVMDGAPAGGGYTAVTGLAPNGENLPGGVYQYVGTKDAGAGGAREITTTNSGYYLGTIAHYARLSGGTSAAISLMSTGSYTEPDTLNYAASINPGTGTFYAGFYNALSGSNYNQGVQIGFTGTCGLALTSSGALDFVDNGSLSTTGLTATPDSNGFDTLSYQFTFIPPSAGSLLGEAIISNIVLNGTAEPTAVDTLFDVTSDTIDYAGFGSDASSGFGAVDSFTISGVVPEPSTYAFLAAGAVALGASRFRRRRNA
jgi:hypothetical protein